MGGSKEEGYILKPNGSSEHKIEQREEKSNQTQKKEYDSGSRKLAALSLYCFVYSLIEGSMNNILFKRFV